MKLPADDFGNAGIVRRFCDQCKGVIVLRWSSADGEFCSNGCLETAAKEKENTMTDTDTTATATPVAPITNGKKAPAKKAAAAPAKKAAAKAAPAKKAATKQAAPAKKVAATANGNGEPFRQGTTKYSIWEALKDGKVHQRADLNTICDEASCVRQVINHVCKDLADKGYTVTADRATIQVKK